MSSTRRNTTPSNRPWSAIGLWFDYPKRFRELIRNGMHYDYSWNIPGQNHLNIYGCIRDK